MRKILLSFLFLFTLNFHNSQQITDKEKLNKCLKLFSNEICLSDTDKDSVTFYLDYCPAVYVSITNNGCPWTDTDGDGVLDKDDRCPKISGDPNFEGCSSKDSDNDGVPDWFDSCPQIKGLKDKNGCPALKDFQKVYYNLVKGVDYDELGDLIFKKLLKYNFKNKIILLNVTDKNGIYPIVCGSSEEESERGILQDNIIQKLYWKTNFSKFLKLFPQNTIVPIASSKDKKFIETKDLKNYISNKNLVKYKGKFGKGQIKFFYFNTYNECLENLNNWNDIINETIFLKIGIYSGKKYWISIFSNIDEIDKNYYFNYDKNKFKEITQKEYFNH